MIRRSVPCLFAALALLLASAGKPDARVAADQKALQNVQIYVGGWKGVGQPKRGSSDGAWSEESEWAWQFSGGRAHLVANATSAKFYSKLQLSAGEKAGEIVLTATPASGGEAETFTGALNENEQLVLTNSNARADRPGRITLRTVAGGDRLLVLYERRVAGDQYSRLAEVGSTRKGVMFAKGEGYPECIVTGGRGTIAVQYEGQTYYVCCTGCRDLFNDDPKGTLAAYKEKKAKDGK